MLAVLQYWFVASAGRFWNGYSGTVSFLEASLAVKDTAKNWSKPLYQDYSREGRLVGFAIRMIRVLSGLLVYALIGAAYACAYAAWMLAPGLWAFSLLRTITGGKV